MGSQTPMSGPTAESEKLRASCLQFLVSWVKHAHRTVSGGHWTRGDLLQKVLQKVIQRVLMRLK